jgi:hypothetical protein
VDPSVPQPKVSAETEAQEELAKIVEDKLRNELDRMTVEAHNDLMERIVRIQGGGFYLVEWDNAAGGRGTWGAVLTPLHPKQIVPQAGVYTGHTGHGAHLRETAADEGEDLAEIPRGRVRRAGGGAGGARGGEHHGVGPGDAEHHVPPNKKGGIGLYSWVNDKELCDLEDYQARRLRGAGSDGQLWTDGFVVLPEPTLDGIPRRRRQESGEGRVPYCGSKAFEETEEEAWSSDARRGR